MSSSFAFLRKNSDFYDKIDLICFDRIPEERIDFVKKHARRKLWVGVAVLLLGISLFTMPLWAGEVLLSRSGLDNLLQRSFLPKEQQVAALTQRADALAAHLEELESLTVSRLLLWPDRNYAELYRPGVQEPEIRQLDVPPQIVEGRTLVPLRFIGEVLGAAVEWNGETRQVSYVTEKRSIVLTLDQKTAVIDGAAQEIDVAPASIKGRTLVPVRFVSQWLGAAVHWDSEARRVEVKYYQAPEVRE